jgi:hypothetical protein
MHESCDNGRLVGTYKSHCQNWLRTAKEHLALGQIISICYHSRELQVLEISPKTVLGCITEEYCMRWMHNQYIANWRQGPSHLKPLEGRKDGR